MREVVREYKCQSIDLAPVSWKAGRLDICENWRRVGMDVTHLEGRHYLPLIDCGLSRFAIWRPLLCQDSASIIQQLETVFYERGCLLSYSKITPRPLVERHSLNSSSTGTSG